MPTPRVSVLIPAYDRERYLGDAIRSTLAQSFRDLECLVIDDGSQDGTGKLAASFDDPRMRVVRNECNLGIPRTRNRGVELCRGEYVAMLDSDDVSLPGRIARQVRFLDAHPDVVAVGSWTRTLGADGRVGKRDHRCPASNAALAFMLQFRSAPRQSTMMIRRDVLAQVRYDERCAVAEDGDLLGRLARDYELRALQEPLVLFRQHPDRISLNGSLAERIAIQRRVSTERLREIGLDPTPEDVDRHLRLTSQRRRSDPALDPDYLDWAGSWLVDLVRRRSGASPHPEVLQTAARVWYRLLRRAARQGVREIPWRGAPELCEPEGLRLLWLRSRHLVGLA